jgi:AcrR family transcriptional regulator
MKAKVKESNRRRLEKRSRRNPEESRQKILEAATEFLFEHPLRDMTVAELMDRTSLGRSSFYVYFRDRYDLAEALLKMIENLGLKAAGPWFEGSGRSLPALRAALKNIVNVFVKFGPVIRSVAEAAPMGEKLESFWSDFIQAFTRMTAERIIRDQKAGHTPPVDAHETAHALIHMNIAYLTDRFGKRPQVDPKTALDTLFGIWACTLYRGEE